MRLCVFCGSKSGDNPAYREAAILLGSELARRGIGLVYGGGRVGMMGHVADAVVEAGGETIGVIPRALQKLELAHTGISELRVVGSMHERKRVMADLSDGFITLPGGFGTMEEFFETVTWSLLGIHHKPCGIVNTGGYYDPLLTLIDRFIEQSFATAEHRKLIVADSDPLRLLDRVVDYRPPRLMEWIDDDEV